VTSTRDKADKHVGQTRCLRSPCAVSRRRLLLLRQPRPALQRAHQNRQSASRRHGYRLPRVSARTRSGALPAGVPFSRAQLLIEGDQTCRADLSRRRIERLLALDTESKALQRPESYFVGYDALEPEILHATENARASGVADRVRFQHLDASRGLASEYDVITTFDVVHDAADPAGLLRSIRRALKPNGRLHVPGDQLCGSTRGQHRAVGCGVSRDQRIQLHDHLAGAWRRRPGHARAAGVQTP
jgi:SAM-dependent methyltransferase